MSLYKSTKEITATPITPSNSSPAVITSGGTYTAQANGKAVSIITEVTPSSTPTSVSINDVVRLGGSGVIVDEVKQEQSKSVTATTSVQTVTPDSGKVLSSVTVNPQVHSATYTPSGYDEYDLGAQNNYRYVDTSGLDPNLLLIRPDNTNIPSMTADNNYHAYNNGYAIASYTEVAPSNNSTLVRPNDIVKIKTNTGYIIKDLPNPDTLTPSDSSPASISNGTMYIAGGNGYAIENQPISVTPSNVYADIPHLDGGGIYKPTSMGELVASVNGVIPSDTSPAALVRRKAYVLPSDYTGDAYLYRTIQKPRVYCCYNTQATASTSWTASSFSDASIQTDSFAGWIDPKFGTLNTSNGSITVASGFSSTTIYVTMATYMGRTSSGTTTYSGLRLLKNGTVVVSAYNSSATATQKTSITVSTGDVLTVETRCNSSTQGRSRANLVLSSVAGAT